MTAQSETTDAVKDAILRKLRLDIGKLDGDSDVDAISEIIGRIAVCSLDGIARERLLQTIKQQTRTALSILRKQLTEAIRAQQAGRSTGQIEGMILDAFGDPCPLEANAVTLLRQKLPGLFALDEFRQLPMVMQPPPWARSGETYPRPLTDADDAALLTFVQRQGVHLRGRPAIRTVMAEIIHDHVFHPVREYLDGLQWDSVPRLNQWLTTYLGAQEVPNYTAIVGPKWMISAVARIFRPGCIAKYCLLLLLGPQDLGKSTALSVLGDEFYTDDIAELGTKDAAMQNAGVWIVELAELASTRKAHLDSVKSFISRATDRFRPPYGTHPIARPRQSVLAGTVNPSDAFLKDDTGNVRFWTTTCTKIDLDALRRDRDQLWAEAVHRVRAGETWWLEDTSTIEAARAEQAEHTETVEDHPWFKLIEDWIRDEEKLVYALAT